MSAPIHKIEDFSVREYPLKTRMPGRSSRQHIAWGQHRSWNVIGLVICCVAASSTRVGAAEAAPTRRPNIVLIVADDLGWADVSLHGTQIKTPHIDSIAHTGAELERFYVCPVCSPTRAGL
ncbi:MAG: sulfatase-like hydrolase/transferase, partial [Planctomycetaceae bacterium]